MSDEVPIKINLGCGDQRLPGYIGLDHAKRAGTHVVCDFNQGLPLASRCVDHAYAKGLLEHVAWLELFLGEVERVLKPGGTFYIYVPHWSNPFYYSDPTHRRFFGLATFDYFVEPSAQIYRQVPVYTQLGFRVISVRLIFDSPFRLLRWMMKGFQWLVNRWVKVQLLYEAHLSSLLPCYAIEYVLEQCS